MGYDQFLTLLCAEMQYQDPLEPTSNTEYVAQLASFSQLEATLSMQDTMTSMQTTLEDSLTGTQKTVETNLANSLVGKYVILAQDDGSYVSGKVDYVMYDTDGSVQVSVNDALYALDTLDTIADADYYEGVALSNTISSMLEQLPDLDEIDLTYQTAVGQIREVYDGMTSTQQNYVSSDNLSSLESYEAKIAELVKAAETTATDSTAEDVVTEEGTTAEETSETETA
jgi:flagellar basal-body rod modification protein FlgD